MRWVSHDVGGKDFGCFMWRCVFVMSLTRSWRQGSSFFSCGGVWRCVAGHGVGGKELRFFHVAVGG